jgi:hypothetical protein
MFHTCFIARPMAGYGHLGHHLSMARSANSRIGRISRTRLKKRHHVRYKARRHAVVIWVPRAFFRHLSEETTTRRSTGVAGLRNARPGSGAVSRKRRTLYANGCVAVATATATDDPLLVLSIAHEVLAALRIWRAQSGAMASSGGQS